MRVVNLLGAASAAALLVACGNAENTPAPAPAPDTGVAAVVPHADPVPPADAAAVFQGVPRLAERFDAPDGLTVTETEAGARLSGGPDAATATAFGRTGGATLRVPAALERNASGGRIRVTVSARAATPAAAHEFSAGYTTREVGASGWTSFALSDQFQSFSFEYDVPAMVDGRGDYVGILPDASGAGQAVEIAFVAVEIVQAGPLAGTEN